VTISTAQCVADWPIIEETEEMGDMMVTIEADIAMESSDMGAPAMLSDIAPPNENNIPVKEDTGCDANARKTPSSLIMLLLMLFGIRSTRRRLA
jgi:hypothetical protein